jgi:hypothetical protein
LNREQLEHIIRASGDVLKEDAVIIVGSQSFLGSHPEGLPREATLSIEADVMAVSDPDGEKALHINGTIGELTSFDAQNGYYAEGVEEPLCRFPIDWRERLVPLNTPATEGVTGLCVEPHDLAVAKLLAGRDKDLKYVRALLKSGHLRPGTLLERAENTSMSEHEMERIVGAVTSVAPPGRKNKARHAVRRLTRSRTPRKPPDGPKNDS